MGQESGCTFLYSFLSSTLPCIYVLQTRTNEAEFRRKITDIASKSKRERAGKKEKILDGIMIGIINRYEYATVSPRFSSCFCVFVNVQCRRGKKKTRKREEKKKILYKDSSPRPLIMQLEGSRSTHRDQPWCSTDP